LGPEGSHAGPGYLWQPSVVGIGDDFERLRDTTAPDRRDDPELGQVRTNGIDDGRLLANEQMPRAMKCQTALLLGGLGRHKPHVWPRYGFANRFRVSRIVLVSFDVRLDVGPVASAVRCDRAPGARATNNVMTRMPRCQLGTAAASQRTSEHNAA
jgi:hypothetical protein